MKFDRGPRSKVPEKVGLRLAGIADRVVAHTEGAPRGSFVQSGTSQEPHKPTTGEVVAHTQLSPLEVPSRPPRRLRAKLPTLSRMGATADWRSQVKNDAPRQARRHFHVYRPRQDENLPESSLFWKGSHAFFLMCSSWIRGSLAPNCFLNRP